MRSHVPHFFARSRRFRPATIGLLSLSLLAGAASGARAESYFSAFIGTSRTQSSDLHIVNPSTNTNVTFHDVKWSPKTFSMPPYYGWKIGGYSEKTPHWGAELDYVHYKVFVKVDETSSVSGTWNGVPISGSGPLSNYVQRFDISHGVNTFTLNLLYRWTGKPTPSFPHGRLQPYVGAGPTYYVLHPENTVDGIPNKQRYKAAGVGWQAQGGVRYGLSKRVTLFSEVKYSSGEGEVDTSNGTANTDLHTWQNSTGIQYHF